MNQLYDRGAHYRKFVESLVYELPGLQLLQVHLSKVERAKIEEIRRNAFNKMKASHPDHGGTCEAFRIAYKEWKRIEGLWNNPN